MGILSGISNVLGGIGKIFQGLGGIAKAFSGILKSPLGALLTAVFPPLGAAAGVLNFVGMMGDLSGKIGGGASY